MDTKQGNVYCCVCQNYLFDDELSQIARKVNNIACTLKDSSAEYQYTPSRRERIILKAFSEPVKAPYKGKCLVGQISKLRLILTLSRCRPSRNSKLGKHLFHELYRSNINTYTYSEELLSQ